MEDCKIPYAERDLFFFDVETTGLNVDRCAIVEIAALRVSADLETQKGSVHCRIILPAFHTYELESEALALNGYGSVEWATRDDSDLVNYATAFDRFHDLATADGHPAILVGHNPHFDLAFLDAECRRRSISRMTRKYVIDTSSLAWPLVLSGTIERCGLQVLAQKFGIPTPHAHRAMDDVNTALEVYRRLTAGARAVGKMHRAVATEDCSGRYPLADEQRSAE